MGNIISDIVAKIAGGTTSTPGDDTLKLLVNGKSYEGWQQISVKRSMKAISGSFSLRVVEKWAQEQVAWAIAPGDECSIKIGSDTVITGYVDSVSPSFDKDSRGLSVSGRDKTGDLVDCSVDQKPGTWTNISLLALAKKIAAPFGIQVTSKTNAASTIFPSWVLLQGESGFETLERAARLCGVLLMNDGEGAIVIDRAGTGRSSTEIVQGQNMIEGSANYDQKERYSTYTVKSQSLSTEESTPGYDFSSKGTATDPGVKRKRPLVILAEGVSDAPRCRLRAQWEAAVRIGKSSRIAVTVLGWRQSNGNLWAVNEVTKVNSSWLGINVELLITSVSFSKGEEGTLTHLELEPSAAYTPDPTYISKKDPWRQIVISESKR